MQFEMLTTINCLIYLTYIVLNCHNPGKSRAGVNIFLNKWIFHPRKVSHFAYFREEFPNFTIRTCCWKSSFMGKKSFQLLAGENSLSEKVFLIKKTYHYQEDPLLSGKPFPITKTFPYEKNPSRSQKHFSIMRNPSRSEKHFSIIRNSSLSRKPFPIREVILYQKNSSHIRETLRYQGNPSISRKTSPI